MHPIPSRHPAGALRVAARWLLWLGSLVALPVGAATVPGVGTVPEIPAFLPLYSAVPGTEPMPIDGTWTISSIGKTLRIERGRAWAVDPWLHLFVLKIQPGMVVIQDIRPAAPGSWSGQDLPLVGTWSATLTRDRFLDVQVQGVLGPARYQLLPLRLDRPDWLAQTMAEAGLGPAPVPGPAPWYAAPPQQAAPSGPQYPPPGPYPPPQYGQAPPYGQPPQYGQAPPYGQPPQYGQAPPYPPPPAFEPPPSADAGSPPGGPGQAIPGTPTVDPDAGQAPVAPW